MSILNRINFFLHICLEQFVLQLKHTETSSYVVNSYLLSHTKLIGINAELVRDGGICIFISTELLFLYYQI